MSKTTFAFLALAIGLTFGHTRVFSQQENQGNGFVRNILKNQDTNGDGKVSKSEAKNQLKSKFDRIDRNSDGFLGNDELRQLARQLASQNRQRNNKNNFAVPEDVQLVEDISYREGSSEKWKLDLFLPKTQADNPRAAIVFIHGGGWRSGDKGGGQWRSLPIDYAQKGYVCISVNYRLTGEAPFPACIEDCKNAVRWLRAHAQKYNVNPKRIGAYGNSAGAHLVAMLGLTNESAKLEGDGTHLDYSSSVNAVVCSATPTNLFNWDGESEFNPRMGSRLFGFDDSSKAAELAKKYSPRTYVKSSIPFLVVHGTADKTVPIYQGDSFVEALKQAGADVKYIRVDGAGHGVFGQASSDTYPAMKSFFEKHLALDE